MMVESKMRASPSISAGTSLRRLAAANEPQLARAQGVRRLDVELQALLAQRDLDLLGVGQERMLIEQHHGSSSRTATAALAMIATSPAA